MESPLKNRYEVNDMYNKAILKPPFFEIGPKQYIYGDEVLELA